ncbi:ATP-binding protein [Actinoplanes sp. CA-030573]|uniref:ATP-binding protein n=1 Tax=Actinoplanes sp. CA-030573 TaxID=3239898 RepID=UPI003D9253F5
MAVAVYRSVAEGVTNALRHARAERVTVSVRGLAGGGVVAEVGDDGEGGPIAYGVGLSSLRRRAEELGGVLDVTAGGTGTRLRLELPA